MSGCGRFTITLSATVSDRMPLDRVQWLRRISRNFGSVSICKNRRNQPIRGRGEQTVAAEFQNEKTIFLQKLALCVCFATSCIRLQDCDNTYDRAWLHMSHFSATGTDVTSVSCCSLLLRCFPAFSLPNNANNLVHKTTLHPPVYRNHSQQSFPS